MPKYLQVAKLNMFLEKYLSYTGFKRNRKPAKLYFHNKNNTLGPLYNRQVIQNLSWKRIK